MTYGKKSFGQKIGGGLKKLFLSVALVGGAVGAPAYYHYGTVEEDEVKVTYVEKGPYKGYDSKTWTSIYEPGKSITTDKGTFNNENSLLHLKFNAPEIQNQFQSGKIYRIKSYGGVLGLDPKILSAREVTPEEIAERKKMAEEDKKRADQERLAQQGGAAVVDPAVPVAPGQVTPAASGLSGATTKVIITAEGFDIQMTVPTEVVNKIRIDKVSETKPVHIVQPPAPSPGG